MPARPSVLIVLLTVLLAGCAAGTDRGTTPVAAGTTASTPPAPGTPAPGTPAPGTPDPGTPSAGTPSAVTSAPPASPSASPTPAFRTIDVAYAGGEVTGTTGREEVALGERVVLRLTSDVAEEVHVHGYDLVQKLPAGVPVEIPLTASIPGGFEVELHDSGRALFQLRVV